jgi:hypothetical protein
MKQDMFFLCFILSQSTTYSVAMAGRSVKKKRNWNSLAGNGGRLIGVTSNGTFHLRTGHLDPEMMYSLYFFFKLGDRWWGRWSMPCFSRFTPEKETWHSLYRKVCGHEDSYGWVRKTCFTQMLKFVHWIVRVADMIYAHGSQVFSLLRFPRLWKHTQLEIRFETKVWRVIRI